MSATPILPGPVAGGGRLATLGVMGGGQLGRMFVHAAQALGYQTAVLDPDATSPAGRVSDYHVATAYDDEQGLAAGVLQTSMQVGAAIVLALNIVLVLSALGVKIPGLA